MAEAGAGLFDLLGAGDFLGPVEQRNLAHLHQVHPHRVVDGDGRSADLDERVGVGIIDVDLRGFFDDFDRIVDLLEVDIAAVQRLGQLAAGTILFRRQGGLVAAGRRRRPVPAARRPSWPGGETSAQRCSFA